MIPLRVVETEREGFDEPVIELWRDDEFVGFVFWDDGPIVQIFKDRDDDVFDLDLRDLMRVLDLAERIVSPEADELGDLKNTIRTRFETLPGATTVAEDDDVSRPAVGADGWDDEDPAVLALVEEFDPLAVHRSDDSESYFDKQTALRLVAKCEELDLAVVEMEAFDRDGAVLIPRPNLATVIHDELDSGWEAFRRYANITASGMLDDWPGRASLVIAFVIQRPDGETIVV